MSGRGNRLRRKAGIVWIPASFLFLQWLLRKGLTIGAA